MASDGPLEIEAKVRLVNRPAFEARLAALGAKPGPSELETNALLDDRNGTLQARGEVLRLRSTEGRGLLTLKGRARLENGVKSRVELESDVASPDVLLKVFHELGFLPRFHYEKRRTVWRFEDAARPLVVVDETPIGLFAEIEGDEPAVRALAKELGLPESEFLPQSYVSLYRAAREKDPSLPPDMRFPGARA
jgi:adenylate cyclase class 2